MNILFDKKAVAYTKYISHGNCNKIEKQKAFPSYPRYTRKLQTFVKCKTSEENINFLCVNVGQKTSGFQRITRKKTANKSN